MIVVHFPPVNNGREADGQSAMAASNNYYYCLLVTGKHLEVQQHGARSAELLQHWHLLVSIP